MIKLKILKCKSDDFWYRDFIGIYVFMNDRIGFQDHIIPVFLNRELRKKFPHQDKQPFVSVLVEDCNYKQVIRKMKLKKLCGV